MNQPEGRSARESIKKPTSEIRSAVTATSQREATDSTPAGEEKPDRPQGQPNEVHFEPSAPQFIIPMRGIMEEAFDEVIRSRRSEELAAREREELGADAAPIHEADAPSTP